MTDRPGPDAARPAGPIYIGGTGRSGTTLLVRLLGKLPGVYVHPFETKFLVAPGGLLTLAQRGWRSKDLDAFVGLLRDRWFEKRARKGTGREVGLSTMVTRDQLEEAIEVLRASVRDRSDRRDLAPAASFCHALFRPPMERAGAHRWGEKTPRNVLVVDQLHTAFPDMRFVHVVRDGRDVVASMLAKGFWPVAGQGFGRLRRLQGALTPVRCARYWVEVLRLAREAASRVPPESYLELRLEDLVARPEPELRRVCEFLGEPFAPELLGHDFSHSHSGRWRSDLSDADRAAIQRILSPALEREGYAST